MDNTALDDMITAQVLDHLPFYDGIEPTGSLLPVPSDFNGIKIIRNPYEQTGAKSGMYGTDEAAAAKDRLYVGFAEDKDDPLVKQLRLAERPTYPNPNPVRKPFVKPPIGGRSNLL